MDDTKPAKRRDNGTFGRGMSGNPKGRPRKQPERLRMPEALRNVAFEVAEMPMFNVRGPHGAHSRQLALLSFLAPDLQRQIFEGVIADVEFGSLPLSWARQRELPAGPMRPAGSMVFKRNHR